MSMKNTTGELLDALEGGHVGHGVVTGGYDHVVKPLPIQNLGENRINTRQNCSDFFIMGT